MGNSMTTPMTDESRKSDDMTSKRDTDEQAFEQALKNALEVDQDDYIDWCCVEVDSEELAQNMFTAGIEHERKRAMGLVAALMFYESRTVFYEKSLFPGDYAKINCTDIAEEALAKYRG